MRGQNLEHVGFGKFLLCDWFQLLWNVVTVCLNGDVWIDFVLWLSIFIFLSVPC
jgi:hypothetical protein